MIVGTTVCFPLNLNARVGAWDCANHVNATDAQPQQIRVPDFVLVLIGNPKYPGNPNPAEWPIFASRCLWGLGLRWFVARRSIQLSYGRAGGWENLEPSLSQIRRGHLGGGQLCGPGLRGP